MFSGMGLRGSQDENRLPCVIGTAGGGLVGAGSTWAANDAVANMGRRGELDTAAMLNKLASMDGVTVLHDLRIPIPGFTANIDHAVVSGRKVWLIDAKRWAPAFYWTVGGKTRRGWSVFKVRGNGGRWKFPAESKTMPTAYDSVSRLLTSRGASFSMQQSLIVVWPSSAKGRLSVRWLRMPGSKAVDSASFARYARHTFRSKPADQRIVEVLASLTSDPTPVRRPARKPSTGTSQGAYLDDGAGDGPFDSPKLTTMLRPSTDDGWDD